MSLKLVLCVCNFCNLVLVSSQFSRVLPDVVWGDQMHTSEHTHVSYLLLRYNIVDIFLHIYITISLRVSRRSTFSLELHVPSHFPFAREFWGGVPTTKQKLG